MDLSRADSKVIKPEDRKKALTELGILKTEPFAIGSEAEVYERDDETLLKIYAGSERLEYFKTLRKLYESVDVSGSGIHLPQILEVIQYGSVVAVIETRLEGKTLQTLLPNLQDVDLSRAEYLYLDAVGRLKDIKLRKEPKTYLLFDHSMKSETSKQSFESFYSSFLEDKIGRVGQFFSTFDGKFADKAAALVTAIRNAPQAQLALVHGDFCPGNVLVNKDVTAVYGVIDFGSFTLFGNYLLDRAGAFGFYKMYDRERQVIRKRMLPKARQSHIRCL